MSQYLVERIERRPNIEVLFHTTITGARGEDTLKVLELDRGGDEAGELPVAAAFVFIGAQPHTAWLPETVARDAKGFVYTGQDAQAQGTWTEERAPCALETTLPGLFVAGDARHGSTKRVAFAAGDGALAVSCIHEYLSLHRGRAARPQS